MSVSVLIPSYNHAPFVERTLRSVFKQTQSPKELIVIDDGSKDESAHTIKRILQDCPFPSKLIVRENRGLCATLNEGFSLSCGEFFAYISSDDVWLPTFLESRCEVLNKRNKALLAFGHSLLLDENDQIIDRTDDWTVYEDGNILNMLLRGIVPASASIVYRSSTLKLETWNEDSPLEDYELYLKLSAHGEFALDSNVLSGWRQHGWNVSGNYPLMLKEWLEAQGRVSEKLDISNEELSQIQAELKFNATSDFVRRGLKKEAWQMFSENLSGAKSTLEIGKMMFRLAIPNAVFQWNRKRKLEAKIEKFGRLEI
jgi:alpha-1,3-rhamnosyltransferase